MITLVIGYSTRYINYVKNHFCISVHCTEAWVFICDDIIAQRLILYCHLPYTLLETRNIRAVDGNLSCKLLFKQAEINYAS